MELYWSAAFAEIVTLALAVKDKPLDGPVKKTDGGGLVNG
jgi:hypothetical protein